MYSKPTLPLHSGMRAPAATRARGACPSNITLTRADANVAAVRTTRGIGNAYSETWMMFTCANEFEAWCAYSPLRFTDPLRLAQLKKEFDHAFLQHDDSTTQTAGR